MKRLSYLLLACMIGLILIGCGEDKEKKFSQEVENNLQTITIRLDHAVQAKNSLDTNLKNLTNTSDQLRDEINSLRSSINQLNDSLNDLQNQVSSLNTAQSSFKSKIQGGSFWKWVIIIFIVVVIAAILWMRRQPKPYDEEEEEDFSAFDEELGYEEPVDEIGGGESDNDTKPGL